LNSKDDERLKELKNDELYKQKLEDYFKKVLRNDFWFSSRELEAAATYLNLHIIELSYKTDPIKTEYKPKLIINQSSFKHDDNKLYLVVRKQSLQCKEKLPLNIPNYYRLRKPFKNRFYDVHNLILAPGQEDIYSS